MSNHQTTNPTRCDLLQILVDLQYRHGHVSDAEIQRLAAELGLGSAEIRGMVDFYSFLSREPRGRYDIRVSDNIVDRMAGSREMAAALAAALGIEPGRPGADASLDFTSCTGMGDQGPAILVNGHAIACIDAARTRQVADLVNAGTALGEWPRSLFEVDLNIRRSGPLLDDPLAPGAALRRVDEIGIEAILGELDAAGLRGRGGAGFPTARKWRLCREAPGDERVVVCNADEGEPGTFKDRVLLQAHAERLFEGMAVCARVIGAGRGFLYLRGEYRYLLQPLEALLADWRRQGRLGADGGFDIAIHLGAGAYVCGEESALIESLEGRRGIPRIRPPFPVVSGYLGRPTVVNNVETFVAAAMIAARGPDWLRDHGTEQSAGTRLLSVSGDCARPGIYEIPFGTPITEVLELCGAADTQAVQVGGPSGSLVPPSRFDRGISYEEYSTGGSFMVFDGSRDLVEVVQNFTDFFTHESCGFCTPCRVGGALLGKRLQKISVRHATGDDLEQMRVFSGVMRSASHCGLGQTAANPVRDLLEHFPQVVKARLRSTSFEPAFDLNAALEDARQVTGRRDPDAYLEGGGV